VFEKTAIEGVSIEIASGEFVGVIGHTGSGKSTLIQHLNGLLVPTKGRVLIGGEDIWANKKEIRRFRFKVGLVFQYPEYQLFEETVYKDIAFGPKNMGLSEGEIDDRVREAAALVELPDEVLPKSPFEISGGQKRRAAIAGVVAMRPGVLVLDEPTAGLDPRGRDRILGEIKRLHQKTGTTILLVSHSMEDVARHVNRVLVMNQAKVFIYDTVRAVFSRADEIELMGLSAPQVTKICAALHAGGYDIDPNTFTVEDAKGQILRLLKGGMG